VSKLKQFVDAVESQEDLASDMVCVPKDVAIVVKRVAAGMLAGARKSTGRPITDHSPKAQKQREAQARYRARKGQSSG
jgi:hypothetical protein